MISADRVDKLVSGIWSKVESLEGKELSPDRLSALEGIIYGALSPKSHKGKAKDTSDVLNALHCSLFHLRGQVATRRLLVANITRVVANWQELVSKGVPVPEWTGEPITAGIVVLSVLRDDRERPGLRLRVKLKTGLAAGVILWFRFSEGQCVRFLESHSGCHGRECAPEEVSGMHAMAVGAALEGKYRIERLWCTDAQRAHNRQLTDLRSQVSKCVRPLPCNVCRKTVGQCSLAVWADKEKEK